MVESPAGTTYKVTGRVGDRVLWIGNEGVPNGAWRSECSMEGWTNYSDTVLHVAGEPEAESAIDIHDDRVEMATTIAGLRDDVASLRRQLQAAIIERDAAKARSEGPPAAVDTISLVTMLPASWMFLNDGTPNTTVLLHTSGLWMRVNSLDTLSRPRPEVNAILSALSAAVDAGATGERVLVVGTRPWAELRVRS